ncbi:MAG: lactonase family protein [Bacteroidales bacterium]|nr:lactonase family protein [Bacteroidales bacterium]
MCMACVSKKTDNGIFYLLIGTYTSGGSTGIYVYRMDTEGGTAEYVSETPAVNPSYLAVSADERFVYSVGETESSTSAAHAFAFDKKTGVLTPLNTQPTNGEGPCYINTDKESRFVVTANYRGGNVSVFPLAENGMLETVHTVFSFEGTGPDSLRQEKPHLHCVLFSPDGQYLFAEDLGTDKIHKFTVSANAPFLTAGTPASFNLEPGSGPRHLTFHPNGKYAYLMNELSGKVTAFRYDGGNLQTLQYIASDTTAGVGGKGGADIHVSPDGKFLYTSNRLKSDGIAIFSINEKDGTLTAIAYQLTGIHPRNFNITPNGKFLLVGNRDTNNIQIFGIDQQTGLLTDTGNQILISSPVCLKFIHP